MTRSDDADDVDARFADIVAHWDAPPQAPDSLTDAEPPSCEPPSSESPSSDVIERPRPTGEPSSAPESSRQEDRPKAGEEVSPQSGWRSYSPPEDEDDGFEPARPSPLPDPVDWTFWGAMIGLVGGPLFLLYRLFFHPDGDRAPAMIAIGLVIAGFVLLVLRSPQRREPDDDDDGAVV